MRPYTLSKKFSLGGSMAPSRIISIYELQFSLISNSRFSKISQARKAGPWENSECPREAFTISSPRHVSPGPAPKGQSTN